MEERLSSPEKLSSPAFSQLLQSNTTEPQNRDEKEEGGDISTVQSISNQPDPPVDFPPSTLPSEPCSNPNLSENGAKVIKRKKRVTKEAFVSSSSSSSTSLQKGLRVTGKRRNPKVISAVRSGSDLDALALPLGMSIAAVVAQVLDRKDIERISADHLSLICSSAVKESLANVFGHRYDCFVKNFEKSFGSTLRTLRLINEASLNEEDSLSHSSIQGHTSKVAKFASDYEHGHASSISEMNTPATVEAHIPFPCVEEVRENKRSDTLNRELSLHGQINQQLAYALPSTVCSGTSNSVLSTFEKSIAEQSRSNDLKTFEIGLMMKRLQLEESQLALSSASNRLERFKLSFGISKASFKAEKFKNQLEETRHAELLKKCVDCLVAGLVLMCASLIYGAYVFSYKRISEVTSSCMVPPKESSSWFSVVMPKSVSTFSSGIHMVRCQVVVVSRMLFGVFMILAIAYLLLQRSSASNQSMPITFILLLLGVLCGSAGKLCVDTLGGSGFSWFLYWEALCLLHFFANICTSTLFSILHGPVSVSQGISGNAVLPYWLRRSVFYSITLFCLPLFCGLMPFAGLSDWTDHFVSVVSDAVGSISVEGS